MILYIKTNEMPGNKSGFAILISHEFCKELTTYVAIRGVHWQYVKVILFLVIFNVPLQMAYISYVYYWQKSTV